MNMLFKHISTIHTIPQVEVVDGATTVSFRHNEKPLGAAFSIEGWTGDKLRPVVSLGSKGQVHLLMLHMMITVILVGTDIDSYDDNNAGSVTPTFVWSLLCQRGRAKRGAGGRLGGRRLEGLDDDDL